MPHIKVGDINIYYEIHGSGGPTLTLIRGLGADLKAWFAQIPELSQHFRVIAFDNRGAGRTDKPDSDYSTRQMAADVNGLLDALNVRRTALLGVSMGGMIAQEFAINYGDKLSCLILGCTHFGGRHSVSSPPEMFKALLAAASADEEMRRVQEQALFCDDTIANNRALIDAHGKARSHYPTPAFSLARQFGAISSHDTENRLGQISAPTLVVTGKDDRLIPPENSRLLAAKIPGANLMELAGGHLFTSEYADRFNRAVSEFVNNNAE